jgi:hypothetical protein
MPERQDVCEAILNIVILSHPCDHDIASMDDGTYDLSGAIIMTVTPEHRLSFTSM